MVDFIFRMPQVKIYNLSKILIAQFNANDIRDAITILVIPTAENEPLNIGKASRCVQLLYLGKA